MNEHEDLIARLRALGSEPVRADVAGQHLAAIEAVPFAVKGRTRSRRLRIVAAFAVGLFAGTTGLATAGALPDGAQEVAHRTLGAVGVNVPHGDRYQGPECGGEVKNHGQYVRSQPKDKRAEAAARRCGKPIQAGTGDDADEGKGQGGQCQGPPPWAGRGKPDEAAKAARKQACGKGQDDGDDKDTLAPAAGAQPGTPLTPEASPTTGPSPSTSPTTGTTATTGPADTTEPTGTTTSTARSEGTPAPSLPVVPPPAG